MKRLRLVEVDARRWRESPTAAAGASLRAAAAGLSLSVSTVALAHAGGDRTSGFVQGLLHPLTGVDHVLTMIAVGLLGVALGRAALWLAPVGFLLGMQAGAWLGYGGAGLPSVEIMIWTSVLTMGSLLVLVRRRRLPLTPVLAAVGSFGVFHGHAHGVMIPPGAAASYGLGFTLATAALHAAGIVTGLVLAGQRGQVARRC